MRSGFPSSLSRLSERLVRARAKVLARQDRELKASLIRLRQDACLTQKQVAELIGVSQQAIHKLERYDSDPKLSTLRRYANAVGAIVEHTVTPDVGQSVFLASASRWDSIASMRPVVVASRPTVTAIHSRGVWADAKSTDFALAR